MSSGQPRRRAAFYDPYVEILGGGEKYLLSILEAVLDSPGTDVSIMSPHEPDIGAWGRLRLDVDPTSVRWRRAGALSVTPRSRGADLFVALANHVPPLSLARRSAVVLQFPFEDLSAPASLGARLRRGERRARFASYDTVLCYSEFVRDQIAERLHITDAVVLPPPVDLPAEPTAEGEKQHLVLAVGRFFPAADANNKKHEVLIDGWRQLQSQLADNDWELHLAGGVHDDGASQAHLASLRERAQGLAVFFHPNVVTDELDDLYARAALFWHAAGHGESRPERLEHFGITTVEAMARACVPVVPARGGQLEIVSDGYDGRLWRSVGELVSVTAALMQAPAERRRLAERAVISAQRFGKARFVERVRSELLAPAGIGA